jgi:hypothetical protein
MRTSSVVMEVNGARKRFSPVFFNLIRTRMGQPLTAERLAKGKVAAMRAAGIDAKYTAHSCRGTGLTAALTHGNGSAAWLSMCRETGRWKDEVSMHRHYHRPLGTLPVPEPPFPASVTEAVRWSARAHVPVRQQ